MKPLGLSGFDARFAEDPDPWSTWTDRDERIKREAILHALGDRIRGRVLELGAGNGSNSVPLAARSLRLDATEGAPAGAALVAEALAGAWRGERGTAAVLALPAPPPRPRYDAVVVAELLYYLPARDMAQTARLCARALRPGGRLVLAHHRIQFHDFAQHAEGIHPRFLRDTGMRWRPAPTRFTRRWRVEAFDRL